MKNTILILLTTIFTFGSIIRANSQNNISEFKVLGNCGMCQKRIEKAVMSISGVSTASWDKETKKIKVNYDKIETSIEEISLAINAVGHDTEYGKAQNEIYNTLPGCCKYDRDEANTGIATTEIVKSFSFSVNGKCGMCKKRIEKVAKSFPEVVSAEWNKESKMLTVDASNKSITKKIISEAIASVGHDTEFDRAKNEDYDALPGCCHYNRTL